MTDGAPERVVRRRVPTAVLALVGVLIGGLVGWGAYALTTGDDDTDGAGRLVLERGSGATDDPVAAAKDFLAAWERYRRATYTATLTFERTASNGQSLQSTSTFAQAPPRRIVRQDDGSLVLTDGASSVRCDKVGAAITCAPAAAGDYDAQIADELGIWRTAVLADVPYYRVSEPDDHCFQLDLVVTMVDPPYGRVARFCFDATTGALLQRQIVRDGATDTEEATALSTAIPADAFTAPTTTVAR